MATNKQLNWSLWSKMPFFLYPATLSNGTKETLVLGLDENGNEIRVEGFLLETNQLQFTNEKPYVIYGYAAIPEGNTLTVDAGARVHFHKDSGLLVNSWSFIAHQRAVKRRSRTHGI